MNFTNSVESGLKFLMTEISGSNKFLARDFMVYTGHSFRYNVYSSYDKFPERFNTE
jgi:hypothetical protein